MRRSFHRRVGAAARPFRRTRPVATAHAHARKSAIGNVAGRNSARDPPPHHWQRLQGSHVCGSIGACFTVTPYSTARSMNGSALGIPSDRRVRGPDRLCRGRRRPWCRTPRRRRATALSNGVLITAMTSWRRARRRKSALRCEQVAITCAPRGAGDLDGERTDTAGHRHGISTRMPGAGVRDIDQRDPCAGAGERQGCRVGERTRRPEGDAMLPSASPPARPMCLPDAGARNATRRPTSAGSAPAADRGDDRLHHPAR